jgi:hypothetical protein
MRTSHSILNSTTRSLHLSRAFVKAQIVIHKLMIITAFILLPLLAWHNATVHLFEDYGLAKEWKKTMRNIQLAGLRTVKWVAMWIFVRESRRHVHD